MQTEKIRNRASGSSGISIEVFTNNLNLTSLTFLCKINIEGFQKVLARDKVSCLQWKLNPQPTITGLEV